MQRLVPRALSRLPFFLSLLHPELLLWEPRTRFTPSSSSCVPSYQGEEQEVQLYYKMFSSTRHGFLGAGVLLQPLSHVWAAVSDPTLWPLYHKPIQTVRLHQRVTNSISLGTRGGLCVSGGRSGQPPRGAGC